MAQPQQKQELQQTGSKELPQPLGPDSYMWRDFGSYLFHLMLPQAFVLQAAHPVIDAAVSKDKKYKLDPWGRAKDSTKLLWPVVYSRPEKATAMGIRLRELHRSIKGVDKNGKKYHALDPEAYAWVHITGFDASLRMAEYFGTKPTTEQRARMFAEWKRMGAMLGIHEKHIPQTEEEYWKHFNYIIEERLARGDVLNDLLNPNMYQEYPKPEELKQMPDVVFKAMMGVFGFMMHRIMLATLPDNFRSKFGVKFSKTDKRLFNAFAWTVRKVYPLTPQRSRYIPLAWRAIQDAKQHPEAYEFEQIGNTSLASV